MYDRNVQPDRTLANPDAIGAPMSLNFRIHSENLVPAIQSLEAYFRDGGASILQAAFHHTYFVHPQAVLDRTPLFPERARRSREHYPGIDKGQSTIWKAGDGREIILDDNSRAQMAWERYTGHGLVRRSGYGIRHIWGNTHNPDAFTAGWNLCYMPFWAGMLTEDQHPHPELQTAIRKASWDLYFSDNPVCEAPDFVSDPGIDLAALMDGTPLMILSRESRDIPPRTSPQRQRGSRGRRPTLPITLEPPNSEDFLDALLRAKKAWIQVTYRDGRTERQPWNASNMRTTSNVLGNLRSRPEFRSDAWQNNGIASVRVTIEEPPRARLTNTEDTGRTGWRRLLARFFSRREAGNQ